MIVDYRWDAGFIKEESVVLYLVLRKNFTEFRLSKLSTYIDMIMVLIISVFAQTILMSTVKLLWIRF